MYVSEISRHCESLFCRPAILAGAVTLTMLAFVFAVFWQYTIVIKLKTVLIRSGGHEPLFWTALKNLAYLLTWGVVFQQALYWFEEKERAKFELLSCSFINFTAGTRMQFCLTFTGDPKAGTILSSSKFCLTITIYFKPESFLGPFLPIFRPSSAFNWTLFSPPSLSFFCSAYFALSWRSFSRCWTSFSLDISRFASPKEKSYPLSSCFGSRDCLKSGIGGLCMYRLSRTFLFGLIFFPTEFSEN